MVLSEYEQQLLSGWEDVHNKGRMTLWVLLSLKHGNKHMADIKAFLNEHTNTILNPDDKSMYRALRRFEDADLIAHETRHNPSGPDQKVFHLTETGGRILQKFVERNIEDIYLKKTAKELFSSI